MAASRKDKALGRAADVREAIRESLGESGYPEAVYTGSAALLSELAKARRFRPAEAALIHAEVAATLAALAARIHGKKPLIPEGYVKGNPQPEDLLAVFDAVTARADEVRHG